MPKSPRSRSFAAAASIAAQPAFMSVVPRPNIRPPLTVPAFVLQVPESGTVSRWPLKSSRGAPQERRVAGRGPLGTGVTSAPMALPASST